MSKRSAAADDRAARLRPNCEVARRTCLEDLFAVCFAVGASAALCADVLVTFSTRLWGDAQDPVQNWWNGWWTAQALSRGISPFHTDMLWHPDGANLWLHTLGPLNALLTAAGQATLPGFAGYNLVVFLQLAFGCYGGFVLCRFLLERAIERGRIHESLPRWAIVLLALGGGSVFAFSPYTWGHISTHLHASSLGFVPLFVHALLCSLWRGGWRWPVMAGLWAGLTAACGWYLVFDEIVIASILALGSLVWMRTRWRVWLVRVGAVAGLSALAIAPMLVPTLIGLDQALDGAHDPDVFAADWWSLWVPGGRLALGADHLAFTRQFTGSWENTGYLGYLALFLAVLGLRARETVTLFVAGLCGVVLSLGPHLHVAGVVKSTSLPYEWLRTVLPVLDGLGCPVRFGLMMNLALGAAATLGAAWIGAWFTRRVAPWWVVSGVLVALLGGAVLEYAPAGQHTTYLADMGWLAEETQGPEDLVIADLSGWSPPLYHQTFHGRPILGGYTSRRIQRHVDALSADPVLGPLFEAVLHGRRTWRPAGRRVDPTIDFDWGDRAPMPGVHRDFRVQWTGTLEVPSSRDYGFTLGADDEARLWIDDRLVLHNPTGGPYDEVETTLHLTEGTHRLRVQFVDHWRQAKVRLSWRSEGPLEIISSEYLRTADGHPGLDASYEHRVAVPRLPPEQATAHLRKRKVGWVITRPATEPWNIQRHLGLDRVTARDGITLYRVPR